MPRALTGPDPDLTPFDKMHIRCPHCSTLYEFPAPEHATDTMSVRCSACETVFKVALGGQPSGAFQAQEKQEWHVLRPSSGERRTVPDFRALQRLIIDKALNAEDLVSEDQTNWQRADAIPALGELFDLALRIPDSASPTSTIGRVSRSVATQGTPAIGQSESTATMPGIDDLIRRGSSRRTQVTPTFQASTGSHDHVRSTTPTGISSGSRPLPETRSTARSDVQARSTSPTSANFSPQVSQPLPTSARTTPAPAIPPAPARVPPISVRHGAPLSRPAPSGANHTMPIAAPPAVESRQPAVNRPRSQQVISPMASSDEPVRHGSPAVRMAALDTGKVKKRNKSEFSLGSVELDTDRDFREWGTSSSGEDDFDAANLLPRSRWKGPLAVVLASVLVLAIAYAAVSVLKPELLDALVGNGGRSESFGDDAEASADEGTADGSAGPTEGLAHALSDEGSTPAAAVASGSGVGDGETVPEAAPDATPDDAYAEPESEPEPEPAREPTPDRETSAQPVRLDFDGHMTRGERALERGDYDEALESFGAAADISNRAEPHVGAAEAYQIMGRSDLALLRYRRAISANSRYVPAWSGLAAVQERLGDREALTTWRHVESIARDSRTRARALDAISRLAP